ncbi:MULTISPECIES: DUF485 domain-containing protein [unclassified Streptomyces]|uniref:DUF485 domain-containing protein n=1 Tax=unclassified Streptomyces TaxID=2593676 RepID=UPI0022598819|nr:MULTISPECIES: DUF485 domain-containing protein [unclassified Streptomyces]WSP55514.1 DUF485 domain-containing protein [Streptomyces sp. NBC_01241]WSU23757.1 DUF485 domain-containing protein [Streptomyces sp. NBC_01108]MCX4787204.1 DUF485 domain-containing protein [Streptomyces sp. NBC_01221]MCX4797013.1 DUF485 domain-containing protein [Streptomyces sp. NBC_01242]WSJ38322.1 DUF485 domain-containing protein [Streptomyces sp. NBC_01321]
MSYGSPPPSPSPYSSWPERLPTAPRGHRSPSPQRPDYLLPWQSSDPVPPPELPDPPATPVAGAARHGDLRRLRTAYRLLRRITTLTALGYFVAFLLLSAFAKGLMERPLFGGLNIGLALGLGQFPVTLLAVVLYERTARRTVDPLAARLRRAGAAR